MAVSLVAASGTLEPTYNTDEISGRVSELQYTLGEGPGIDTIRSHEPVFAPDLRTAESSARWPIFAEEATRLGVLALHSFPLSSESVVLGEASLYRRESGQLDAEHVRRATGITALLTSVLLHPEAADYMGTELRMGVHRAAGMVMQQMGGSISDALAVLKATAFVEDRKITDVAAEVVGGLRRFTTDEGGVSPW